MRATIILALLIILAIPACANTLEDFLSPYLYSGENYTADANVTQIDTSGGHYLLIQMRGQDAFFVSRTAEDNATAYSLVNDSSTIFTAIRTLGVSSTYPTQAELDNLTALISAFDASRHPREDDCTQSIGLDRPGATCDLDRCESCMSVPVCSDRIPYNGVDFTHAMYYYSINHAGLSASVVNATAALRAINTSADAAPLIDTLSKNLDYASGNATALLANHLFGCFVITGSATPPQGLEWCAHLPTQDVAYCPAVTLNTTALSAARNKTLMLKNRVITNATILARANTLIAAMQARSTDRVLREQNRTFQAFLAQVQARTDNVTSAANFVLAHVEYPQLEADVATLSQVVQNVSQYGAARNYSAANSTAQLAYALSDTVEEEAAGVTDQYNAALSANDSAAFALFEAQLIVEPSDYSLSTDLSRYVGQKDVVDNILDGKATRSQLNGTISDLRYIEGKATNITAAKKSQLSMEGVTWLGSFASGLSYVIINAVAAVVPLSPADKENYARALPAALTLIAGLLVYLGCLALFALLVLTRKLRLHKVAVVLWVIIFAFLFLMVALVTITAHSIVQRQASRSAYDMFASAIPAYPNAAVMVMRDNSTEGGLAAMRGCGESLRATLAAKGKSVLAYEYAGTSCFPANGTSITTAECDAQSANMPQFVLGYGTETQMAFYSYYQKSALLTGNDDFYTRCYLARALNNTS